MLRYLESGSVAKLPGFFGLNSMAVSPDGANLAVAAGYGRILQWEMVTLKTLPPLEWIGSFGARKFTGVIARW